MKFLNRHLVLKETRVNGRTRSLTIFSYMFLAFLAVALVLSYVWVRMEVLKNGYVIVRLRAERDRLANANRSLEVAFLNLTSLKHVDEKARQLNFTVLPKERVVFVPDSPSGAAGALGERLASAPPVQSRPASAPTLAGKKGTGH